VATSKQNKKQAKAHPTEIPLRIVGGKFRGHKINYHGDPITRPMKNRVREAIFNLVGPRVRELHAIDLFAGTGALGLEALSRGALSATFVERHFPTANGIQKNIDQLGVGEQSSLDRANVFAWIRDSSHFPLAPWLILCAPPYDYFVSETESMIKLIKQCLEISENGSLLVVESDDRFDTEKLPLQTSWDVRQYPPATVSIFRK
jgi:16S rRNA (guanine966-N2)-methyltransferase